MTFTLIDWTRGPWRGDFQGAEHGADVSVIFNHMKGGGAALHRHPYAETFLIRRGRVAFTDGRETTVAGAGQIVVVGAAVPHGFAAVGDSLVEMIDIHANRRFVTEWL